MKGPVRVLCVNGGIMDMGGISSYLMNYYRHIDSSLVKIDFVVHGGKGTYDDEIQSMGGKIYYIPSKSKNLFLNRYLLFRILASGQYSIIHSHMDGMNGDILRLAAFFKIPNRISHSHNTAHLTNNKFKLLLHNHMMNRIPYYATALWACSSNAGKWLYGVEANFDVIPNAIDSNNFCFCPNKRTQLRKELNIEGKYVIGHVGRFDYQKNHEFLIKVFYKISLQDPNAVLVLIGDGKDRKSVVELVNSLDISKKVIFLGSRRDINCLLNIFDVFVLPSRFEGLGIASIEAQANGLTCICSDGVPKDCDITGNVIFLSLDENIDSWVNAIIKKRSRDINAQKKVCNAGYNIQNAAKSLQEKYLEMGEYV